jgi:hypothetical protein
VGARGPSVRPVWLADREIDERSGAALELHRHTPDAFEEARTRLAFGSRLRRARRRIDARLSPRESLSTFEDLGGGAVGRSRGGRARGDG